MTLKPSSHAALLEAETVIRLFRWECSHVIEAFLDLCCGRPGVTIRRLSKLEIHALFYLLLVVGCDKMIPRVLDSQTDFFAKDLIQSFSKASRYEDHVWAAKCLRYLGSVSEPPRLSALLEKCGHEWRDRLVDIAFETGQPSDLRSDRHDRSQMLKQRWVALADEFEQSFSDSTPTSATPTAKRPAENGLHSPAAKAPRTGSGDSQQ